MILGMLLPKKRHKRLTKCFLYDQEGLCGLVEAITQLSAADWIFAWSPWDFGPGNVGSKKFELVSSLSFRAWIGRFVLSQNFFASIAPTIFLEEKKFENSIANETQNCVSQFEFLIYWSFALAYIRWLEHIQFQESLELNRLLPIQTQHKTPCKPEWNQTQDIYEPKAIM